MSGILYGVGVGPGDPKLMTCLAVEVIEHCSVIAIPAEEKELAMSYKIAVRMVKRMEEKECLALPIPMTKNQNELEQSYKAAAGQIIERLKAGEDVAYLTVGDPTIYSTYIYVQRIVKGQGYEARIINGVPSFCAAAALAGDSLGDRWEQIHILPSSYDIEEGMNYEGTKILMKAGSRLSGVKQVLRKKMQEKDMTMVMVENCGTEGERVYSTLDEMPEKAGYYTIVLVREGKA